MVIESQSAADLPVLYGTLAKRIQALLIDAAILSGGLAVILLGVGSISSWPDNIRWVLVGALLAVLLYEPVLVARYGATIGHRRSNLRVVVGTHGGNPGFARALLRFVIKVAFGWATFVPMVLTLRHQALHDLVARTTVQIRDASRAVPGDYRLERIPDDPTRVLPSAPRRALVVLVYLVLATVVTLGGAGVLLPNDCFEWNQCTATERALLAVFDGAWIASLVLLPLLGWRGRLWGARSRLPA